MRSSLLLVFVLMLTSCVSQQGRQLPPLVTLSADELLARMPVSREGVIAQKSKGTLILHTRGYKQKATIALLLAADGRLRVDLFAMGLHLFSLVAGAEQFSAYQPSEKRVLIGSRNGSYLSGLLGAEVTVDDFLQLLRSHIFYSDSFSNHLYSLDVVKNNYVLTCKYPQYLERYWVDPSDYSICRKEQYGIQGELAMSYHLSKRKNWGHSELFPERAELYASAKDVRAEIIFKARALSVAIDERKFSLTVPAGIETVFVDGY